MTLLVSLKNTQIPPPVSQALRQIEFWANQRRLNAFTLKAPWVIGAGNQVIPGWVIDPFGRINLAGALLYTGGAFNGGAFADIVNPIPPALQPSSVHRFPCLVISGFTNVYTGILQVTTTAIQVGIQTGLTVTNPNVYLDGISYYPQNNPNLL